MNQALKQYRALLSTYLQRQRGRVAMLAVLLLGGIALQIANPQILRYFIDSAQGGGATSQLINAAILFIVVAIATQMLNVAATYIAENVGWTATNQLRADLALHTLKLDMSFHKARTPGELIERIDGDVTALANFFSQFVIRVFGSLLLLVGILVALTIANWQIGLMMTAFAVAVVTIITWVQRIAVPYWKIARQTSAELFGFIEERLSGTEDIRSSGAVAYTLGRLAERSHTRLRSERRAALIGSGTWFAPILLFAIGTAAGYLLARSLFDSGQITLGTAYLVFFYTQLMYQPIHELTREIEDLQRATAGIARIQELYATRSSFVDGNTPLPAGALGVEFDRVTFAYDDVAGGIGAAAEETVDQEDTAADSPADIVLDDISLAIKPGRTLGVLGRTGSGKTTLTRLLFRLYDPTGGVVRVGGIDLRDAARSELRQRIGMVTQDVQLFHASVRDNLTFFDPSIPDETIERVLGDLGLLPWLRSLPEGLNTLLAPAGGGLSAGEAQILAFTRVFLRAPGLVILDEASSRLDPASEAMIEHAVDRLLRDRTGIIIAHRLATVLRADDILILEDGQIREYGPRAALMDDPDSRFSELLRVGMDEVLA